MRRLAVPFIAVALILLALLQLERARSGITMTAMQIDTTPATLYTPATADAPLVIVAHGFAGSRQLMEAYSLTLAQAGLRVLAFDFQGHGRNPVPMSGDVTRIDGTTARLVDETRTVIAAGRTLPGVNGRIALLGHSMATDIIIRAAEAEPDIDAIVAISMFSDAVTPTSPDRLLIITGQWEARLRDVADAAMADAGAGADPGIARRSVTAPFVEHIGVLYSSTGLVAARDWLTETWSAPARSDTARLARTGLPLLILLAGIVLLFRPLARRLGPRSTPPPPLPTGWFVAAIIAPAALAPLIAMQLPHGFLPVLVADYLMLHLALYGLLQLGILARCPATRLSFDPVRTALAAALLIFWGIAIFGLALDRYGASFAPTPERLRIILVLALGTVPFMVADAWITQAGRARLWRRVTARVAVFASLSAAAIASPADLGFILIVFPVLLLFYAVHGLMGRWLAQRAGALAAGLGLGVILAWAVGVSFPLFA